MKVYIVVGIVVAVFCAAGEAVVDRPCTSKDECDDGECCQIVNIIVASRKRQAGILPVNGEQQGTCQRYTQEGGSCLSFDVMNGFCGCEPGLTCRSFFVGTPRPIVGTLGRRDMRPGYESRCAP